ncbi:MAG: FeoB-associated Cys-rich membrane protein [Pyramidobacter sp.]
MNGATLLVLLLVAAAAACALFRIRRKKGCACGNCSACPLKDRCSRPTGQK